MHYLAITTALVGVMVSNLAHHRPQKWIKVTSKILALCFAVLCFHEVGWVGLFLAFMSPNVTDVLS